MGLKRALRNNKDKSSSIHIIPLTSPYLCPRHFRVHAFTMSSPFCCPLHSYYLAGSFCGPQWGSFAVLGSFVVQFGDHLRSGIICGLGIICGAVQITKTKSNNRFVTHCLKEKITVYYFQTQNFC